MAGIVYCSRNLTDGFIPSGRVACLLDFSGMVGEMFAGARDSVPCIGDAFLDAAAELGPPVPEEIAKQLVSIGLWEEAPGGYLVHDYLEYNPSKDEVLALRSVRSEAGKKGAQAKASAKASAKPQANGQQSSSKTAAKLCPAPDPVPLRSEIPPTPQGGMGVGVEDREPGSVTRIRRDDGVFGQTQEAWREGIGEHTKLTVASLGRGEVQDLQRVIEHAEGREGDTLIAWVRETALSFARSSDARFGLTPRMCVKWLDAGRPAREPPAKPQREGPSARSYGDGPRPGVDPDEYEARMAARGIR